MAHNVFTTSDVGDLQYGGGPSRSTEDRVGQMLKSDNMITDMYMKLKTNQEYWTKALALKYPEPGMMATTEEIH